MEQLVSVIIPAYNSSKYVEKAMDSVLQQTYKNFEIIIVDDGSADNTKDIVAKYSDIVPNKVKYFYQNNSGVAAARNRGIQEAKGDYIAFLDSDDMWLPEKLSIQMDLFDRDPDISLAHSDFVYFDDYGKERSSEFLKRDKRYFSGDIFYSLFKSNFILTSTVILKKKTLERVGLFDTFFKMSEDYELWLRIANKFKVGYVDKPLSKYRSHESNITCDARKTYFWVNEAINKTVKSYASSRKEVLKILPYRVAKNHFSIGYQLFCNKKQKESREEFLVSIKYKFNIKAFLFYLLTFISSAAIFRYRKFKNKER